MKKVLLAVALLAFVGGTSTFAQDPDKKTTTTTSTTTKKDKKKSGCCQGGGTGQTCDKKKTETK